MKRLLSALLGTLLLAGCVSPPSPDDFKNALGIGDKLTPGQLVIGAIVVYYAKDGFTWEVEDRRLSDDTYRLTVKQGKLKGTGQGEAEVYFKRRAEEIAAIQGCDGYTILSLTQGLYSDYFNVPQRVTEGTIRCNPPKAKKTGGYVPVSSRS